MAMIRLCWDFCKLSSGLAVHFYTCCVHKFEIWHSVCVCLSNLFVGFSAIDCFFCCHKMVDTIDFVCTRCVTLWVCVAIGKLGFENLFATMGMTWKCPQGRIFPFCRIMFRHVCMNGLFHSGRNNWDSGQIWKLLGLELSGFLVPHTHQGFGRSVQTWLSFGSRS